MRRKKRKKNKVITEWKVGWNEKMEKA